MSHKKIVLGVTGGIAAYKSAELTRLLVKAGYQVHVVMTEAATQFIDRVFSGRAAPLVAHLADSRGLTREDIAELEKLLGELKK